MSIGPERLATLERSRRRRLRAMLVGLALALVGWPLAFALDDGSGSRDELLGGLAWAGFAGLVAAVWIPFRWRRRLRGALLDLLVEGRPDLRHLDGERDRAAIARSLRGPGFALAAFSGSGLVEAFAAVAPEHAVEGEAGGRPVGLVQLRLFDARGFAVFRGTLGCVRLSEPCPGLTVVARDRGVLGNLLASAGSGIERVALEDPAFERRFEAYASDQVLARTVLTPVMLERLAALDRLGEVAGFRCAFRGPWLLLAFPGLAFDCPPWRILRPLAGWIERYRARLAGLLEAPARIVGTLALDRLRAVRTAAAAPMPEAGFAILDAGEQPFTGPLSRLVAGVGMPAIMAASGTLFGGLAAFFTRELWQSGGIEAVRPFALWLGLGLAYGAFAIGSAVLGLWRLARTWRAPLRSVRPGGGLSAEG